MKPRRRPPAKARPTRKPARPSTAKAPAPAAAPPPRPQRGRGRPARPVVAPPPAPSPAATAPDPGTGPDHSPDPSAPGSTGAAGYPLIRFETMDSCAGATGIPLTTVKLAKRKGCSAFVGPRVFLAPLLAWIFSPDRAADGSDDGIDWGNELLKERAKHEKLKRQISEREVILKSEVERALATASAKLHQGLLRQDNTELPSALLGLSQSQIQVQLLQAHTTLWETFAAALDALAAPALPENDTPKSPTAEPAADKSS